MLTDILPTGYLGARRADITPGDTLASIPSTWSELLPIVASGRVRPQALTRVDFTR